MSDRADRDADSPPAGGGPDERSAERDRVETRRGRDRTETRTGRDADGDDFNRGGDDFDRDGDRLDRDPSEERPERDGDGGLLGSDPSEELLERGPLEPGSPSLENAAFVLLGASGTAFVFLSVIL